MSQESRQGPSSAIERPLWRIGCRSDLQWQEDPRQHWERKRKMKTGTKAALDCGGSGGRTGWDILTGRDEDPSQSYQKEDSHESHD